MLQRLARSFPIVAKLPVARIRRMPSRKPSASTADDIEATGVQAVAGSVTTSPLLPRRSSRARNTLHSSAVLTKAAAAGLQSVSCLAAVPEDQIVKQESPDSAQPAAPTLLPVPNQPKSSHPPSRKRKAAACADAIVEGKASSVADDSKQVASKAVPHKTPKRSSKTSAKTKSAQAAESAASPDPSASAGAAGSALQQPADSPTRPSKQRKPRAQAVIKTETATVTPLPDEQIPGPAVKPEDGNSTAPQTSSAKQARKQKPPRTKVEVKTEVVTVAEPGNASADDSAVVPGDSVSPKKPRKRQAKPEVSVETLLESIHVVPYRERVIPKKWVGAHVSMGGGMERAVVRAAAIGQFFTTCYCGCHLVDISAYLQHHNSQSYLKINVKDIVVATTCSSHGYSYVLTLSRCIDDVQASIQLSLLALQVQMRLLWTLDPSGNGSPSP